MDYSRRLLAAAALVLASDRSVSPASIDPGELGVTAALKPHQIEGVTWLLRRYQLGVNVILGDEMGLGKTLQAISLLSYLKIHQISPGPFLVLCPLSVTEGWISEFTKFCPTLRILQYVGDKGHRRDLRMRMYEHVRSHESSSNKQLELPFDVLLTTYDIAILDQDFLCQIPWHCAVIDEAQRLKNPSSVLYNVLDKNYVIPRRLLLTGTPVQNNLSELWSLLHFCMPYIFGTLEQFLSTFKDAGTSITGHHADKAKRQFKMLKHLLSAFMLRRTKSLLIENGTLKLPPLTEITVMVQLVPLQRKVYMSILRKELSALLSLSKGASSNQSLQNIVIQLRKACSHPYLFPGIEPEPYEEGEHLIQASGKLLVLDRLLQKLHASGHRVLLFAQMTHTLDILQDFLELRKYTYERLDGSVRSEERFAAIRSFSSQPKRNTMKAEDNQDGAFVFMISTRAGGVGLNLVAADTVIFFEQDWNPQVDKQALQRAHRIGQMSHVLSINLVTESTIEEVIKRRAERKLQLSNNVMGEEDINEIDKNEEPESGDMRSLIFGLHIFDPMESATEDVSEENMMKLNTMTEKVLAMRNHVPPTTDDLKYEIKTTSQSSNGDFFMKTSDAPLNFDSSFDEASYLSWVEKFKDSSHSIENPDPEPGKRQCIDEEKHAKREAARKRAEEKRLDKWEELGYKSLAVKDPPVIEDYNLLSDSGSVHFVYGDCTDPSKVRPSEPAIIFSCVDTSGKWGRGGMFDALANLSTSIPDAYHRAFECGDLHMGDLHLVKLEDALMWVALAVVQSYNPRRKVPRSDISITDLERCLSKASFSAAENSASLHMPRVGYQDGSHRSEWYTIERLLRKYASIYGINIFVYYYRRPSQEQRE